MMCGIDYSKVVLKMVTNSRVVSYFLLCVATVTGIVGGICSVLRLSCMPPMVSMRMH
jgi:hypothetical protein